MTRLLILLVLAASCGVAGAQTVTISKESGETETVPTEATENKPAEPERTCLRSTGSRIVEVQNRRADKDGKPQRCANAFGRVYTAEDLDSTGHANLADALRSLDPRVR
jgi:hypothetical protein